MKMYEKLGIDLTTKEGLEKVLVLCCNEIPDDIREERKKLGDRCPINHNKSCTECKAKRLFAEVPTKKRWQTITCDEDLIRMQEESTKPCSGRCRYCYCFEACNRYGPMTSYLLEEVEE